MGAVTELCTEVGTEPREETKEGAEAVCSGMAEIAELTGLVVDKGVAAGGIMLVVTAATDTPYWVKWFASAPRSCCIFATQSIN